MNDEKCIIREAGDADLPGLAGLYRAFLEESVWSVPDATPNPKLNIDHVLGKLIAAENSAMLVAEIEGEAVGFAWVNFRPGTDRPLGFYEQIREFFARQRRSQSALFPDRAYLAHLFVAADFRRRGIATGLVQAAGDWAKRRGGKSLDLNVLARNEVARALYRNLGMSEFLVHYRMKI